MASQRYRHVDWSGRLIYFAYCSTNPAVEQGFVCTCSFIIPILYRAGDLKKKNKREREVWKQLSQRIEKLRLEDSMDTFQLTQRDKLEMPAVLGK